MRNYIWSSLYDVKFLREKSYAKRMLQCGVVATIDEYWNHCLLEQMEEGDTWKQRIQSDSRKTAMECGQPMEEIGEPMVVLLGQFEPFLLL